MQVTCAGGEVLIGDGSSLVSLDSEEAMLVYNYLKENLGHPPHSCELSLGMDAKCLICGRDYE